MQASLSFAWWMGVAADSQENPFGRKRTLAFQNLVVPQEGPLPSLFNPFREELLPVAKSLQS